MEHKHTPGSWHYARAGRIEVPYHRRGRAVTYAWREGYTLVTETSTTYPWSMRKDCRAEARAEGRRAVFHETIEQARAAITKARGNKITP